MRYSYKGISFNCKHSYDLSDEKFIELKNEFYKKPSKQEIEKELINISKGGLKFPKIKQYYFKEIMAKTTVGDCYFTVEDVFNNKELLGIFVSKIQNNPKVFDKKTEIGNIENCFRLCGHPISRLPSNFPIKTCYHILDKYNVNNNYFDFSCGWGVRLLASLYKNVNYYGVDPNYLLTDKLIELDKDYRNTVGRDKITKIYTQGSETYIHELENKIGLAFSSPPYFKLELYNIGKQSCTKETLYEEWLENYIKPTMYNIKKYLIRGGYFLWNINNYKQYKLVEDTVKIIEDNGFNYLGDETLKNTSLRLTIKGSYKDNSERIMVFKKD